MSTVAAHATAAHKGLVWIGADPAVQLARTQVWEAAPTDLPVLLLGEPGTGRQLAARILHTLSPREEKPFIRVDCAALHPDQVAAVLFEGIPAATVSSPPRQAPQHARAHRQPGAAGPPGALAPSAPRRQADGPAPGRSQPSVLAQADGGTLFLDTMDALPVEVQQQFLFHLPRPSALRTGSPAGIRIVAATRADLQRAARTGSFCAPLFYRLAILPVHLPPLRQRDRDLGLLATHFARQARTRVGRSAQALARDVLEALYQHEWPGNVWELKRFCERVALLPGNQPLTPEHAARLLEAAPWVQEYQPRPVSQWTSPRHRAPGRN